MTAGRSFDPVVWVAAGAATAVAGLGGLTTDIGPWYLALAQPDWKPPDWAFGPGWTVIFACAAMAAITAWRAAPDARRRQQMLVLFGINGALNVLWSVLYFQLRRPDWALVDAVFLWLSVLVLMIALGRYSLKASLWLTPYLLWTVFAGALNWATVRLNGPFSSAVLNALQVA